MALTSYISKLHILYSFSISFTFLFPWEPITSPRELDRKSILLNTGQGHTASLSFLSPFNQYSTNRLVPNQLLLKIYFFPIQKSFIQFHPKIKPLLNTNLESVLDKLSSTSSSVASSLKFIGRSYCTDVANAAYLICHGFAHKAHDLGTLLYEGY